MPVGGEASTLGLPGGELRACRLLALLGDAAALADALRLLKRGLSALFPLCAMPAMSGVDPTTPMAPMAAPLLVGDPPGVVPAAADTLDLRKDNMLLMVGYLKICSMLMCCLISGEKSWCSCAASRLCPPTSKKFSEEPISERLSTVCQAVNSCCRQWDTWFCDTPEWIGVDGMELAGGMVAEPEPAKEGRWRMKDPPGGLKGRPHELPELPPPPATPK